MARQILFILALLMCRSAWADAWVHATGGARDFALVAHDRAARIVATLDEAPVVGHAVRDLADDVARVTGRRPEVGTDIGADPGQGPVVLVATLGRSPLVDTLAAAGKLKLTDLRGQWESFVIATVDDPLPGVPRALVIVGSDARGTAYGVYELAQAIGVSPWTWWADVEPAHRDALYVAAGTRRFGPPSVKYRGIFLNDEDWGLRPWAARTYDPARGNVGPKTYARVFELLLRLKANTLWPAMHPGSAPFNGDPANAALANEYGIVMGSSHAEPMLRNNVGEWTAPALDFNYQTNPEGVRAYWAERVAANGRYENIYTLGMRGIHDSAMQGPSSPAARAALLETIFADQRRLLAQYVDPHVERIPQIFVPYKEVLAQYWAGLKVPDDVTVMWTDDNYGYVRSFTKPAERSRAGGFGVYYHLSYLGAPLSYLWLATTPPALIWEEMRRSIDAGADRIWILNVGDIKPGEIGIEFFMRTAWDIGQWGADAQPRFLNEWAAREFGADHAAEIASVMGAYYRLNTERRPEHLQWWLPKAAPRHSDWTEAQAAARLRAFADLRTRVEALQARIKPAQRDAWFELVAYPVLASALANARFIEGERGHLAAALAADVRLKRLTAWWNTGLAGGKWRGIMQEEPADDSWRSLRLDAWTMPAYGAAPPALAAATIVLPAARFDRRAAGVPGWQVVPGLGRGEEGAVTLLATPPGAGDVTPAHIQTAAPRLMYPFTVAQAGDLALDVRLLPLHPGGVVPRFAVALDGGAPQIVSVADHDGDAVWVQAVLDNQRGVRTVLGPAAAGTHVLRVYGIDRGIAIDSLAILVINKRDESR